LTSTEWKQLQYLIDIVRPFSFLTSTIGQTKEPTICHAFSIYNQLFNHLVYLHKILTQKQVKYAWVSSLIPGINAAFQKLKHYYEKTYTNLGSVYTFSTILVPEHKIKVFINKTSWILGDDIPKSYKLQLDRFYR
jgi:hypothetical protein